MGDNSALRIAGVASLLSVASIVAAIVIGISSGSSGPVAINFGDPEAVRGLVGPVPLLLSFLALVGPTLSLPAGVGWLRLLGHRGSYVLTGVVLWYFGMALVIWQDAMELVLVANLPLATVSAHGAQAEALLAAGWLIGSAIATFMVLGDMISFFGLLLVNLAMWTLGGKWRLLAVTGAAACVLIIGGLALAPARLPGFILFVVWMTATGVAMLRARPAA